MYRVASILLLGLAIACGTTEAPADESLAENTATGKEDSLFQELVFGSYANMALDGEIVSLQLIDTDVDDLPGAHYEGRYNLTERGYDGTVRSSSGFFNVYRYAGERWVRFLDEASGEFETLHAKYSWSYEGDSLLIQGLSGAGYTLEPANGTEVSYACEYGVDDSEYLPFEVTDPYHQTPAELVGELTLSNLASADSYLVEVAGYAAAHEGVSLEEYLGDMDEESVQIYELTWFSSAYEWVRGYQGDTEVGYIFDAGFAGPIAEVGDGDFLGCDNDECSYSIPSDFPSTRDLLAPPLAELYETLTEPSDLSEIQEQQLRTMFAVDGVSTGTETLAELFEYADGGEFFYYDVGEDADVEWIRYYAGDTEVGAFFEAGTANLVGLVGDGEISACVPAR